MAQLIKCPACAAEVSAAAPACPKCGHPIAPQPPVVVQQKKQTNVGCAVIILVALGLFIALLIKGVDSNSSSNTSATNARTNQQPTPAQSMTPAMTQRAPFWDYEAGTDDISGKPEHVASLQSVNTLEFGFPYAGEQHANLVVATYPRLGHQARLEIERGQFVCHSFDDCSVEVRFNDGKPIRMRAAEPKDGDTTIIFILPTRAFVERLANAKEVRIEATFYQQGNRILDFKWDQFDPKKAGF